MNTKDLEQLFDRLGYVRSEKGTTGPDGTLFDSTVFSKTLDSTKGTELEGLSVVVSHQKDEHPERLVISSDLFGVSTASHEISLTDVRANDTATLEGLLQAAERAACRLPENLARTSTTAAALQDAVDLAFEGDAKKFELDYAQGNTPLQASLAEAGFWQVRDSNDAADYFTRSLEGTNTAQALTLREDGSATLELYEPLADGSKETLLTDELPAATPESIAKKTREQLATLGVNRDALVPQSDPVHGTVDYALRGPDAALKFYKVGRVDTGESGMATHYARDLSNGGKQHLHSPDDIEAPVVVETSDAKGALLQDTEGKPFSERVFVAREDGEPDDDFVARKTAAAAQAAEAQLNELSALEKQRIEALESDRVAQRRAAEKPHEVSLNHDRFVASLFKKLDYATERAQDDQTLFGAFARGYQKAERARAEKVARKASKVSARSMLTKTGRELGGLETNLAKQYPGLVIRVPRKDLTQRDPDTGVRRETVAIPGEFLGRSEQFYLFKVDGKNEAIAVPLADLKLGELSLKEGDKLALHWNFKEKSATVVPREIGRESNAKENRHRAERH